MYRESSRLTEEHKLSRKVTDLHFKYVLPCVQGSPAETTVVFVCDLEDICSHLTTLHAKLYDFSVPGS